MRLKTRKKRTVSQKRWLERQLNDPYVARAKREGMRSRAAYKLIEIDDKYRLLKPGARVVDLGAAPGGWSEIAAKRVGAAEGRGKVVGDRHSRDDADRGRHVSPDRFPRSEAPAALHEMLGGGADVVLSDMAANATGHKKTDQLKIMALVEAGIEFAREVLRPAAASSPRCCRAAPSRSCSRELKRDFATVRHVKPQASRADSAELYLLATGFRGGAAVEATPASSRRKRFAAARRRLRCPSDLGERRGPAHAGCAILRGLREHCGTRMRS